MRKSQSQPSQKRLTVTVVFPAATVFDILGNIEVDVGVSFKLTIDGLPAEAEFFADNDEVLDIKDKEGNSVDITALQAGNSEIEVQCRKTTLKIIKVVVRAAKATHFEVTTDAPEPK